MKNIKRLIAFMGVISTITLYGTPVLASVKTESDKLVNNNMTKSEIIEIAKDNNIEIDSNFLSCDSEKKELVELVNDLFTTRSVDGKTYVKKFKKYTQLKYSNGSSTNEGVYVTVVFDTYQDSLGKAITSIRSVTSSLTSNGVTFRSYEQDSYTPKSISPCTNYTISANGTLGSSDYMNSRVKFSFTLNASDGKEF
ncbi:hypothetical protein DVV81_11545 [Clostridium botulinum]|uniref:hypothetical protein n=1 Tax=Clostridium botulinum TaxID=1491 RepID=UPI001967C2A7|nr:hypothetical protein [Clostridium botulinum]MBN1059223.1 hypothetical protein [Clostridium botulinum]MBN1062424.1 hypothetical protein [Clostridium botulinum]MBN1071794.1 hypothetical protein [Clostridium botulinum]